MFDKAKQTKYCTSFPHLADNQKLILAFSPPSLFNNRQQTAILSYLCFIAQVIFLERVKTFRKVYFFSIF